MLRLRGRVLAADPKPGRLPTNAPRGSRERRCLRLRLDAFDVAADLGGVDLPLAREALHEELVLRVVVRRALVPALDLEPHVLDAEGMREERRLPVNRAIGVAPEPWELLRLYLLVRIGSRVGGRHQAGDVDLEKPGPLEDVERGPVR